MTEEINVTCILEKKVNSLIYKSIRNREIPSLNRQEILKKKRFDRNGRILILLIIKEQIKVH